MSKTTETVEKPPTVMTGVLADLAAVTDRLVEAVCATGDGEVQMATAGALLAATDRLTAGVVEVLSRVSHRGVIADKGLTTGTWLMTFGQRTVADERMLAATAERLADMPTLRGWFRNGDVSWPVVRGIVAAVRNLTREQRRWVDDALAADPDRFRRLDAEDRVGAVADLADQARPDLHRERERRATEREYLRWQKAFDGSSQGEFALNAENTAVLEEAIESLKHRNQQRAQNRGDGHTQDTPDGHADDHNHDHDHDHDEHHAEGHDDGDLDPDDGDDDDDVAGGRDGYVQRQSWSNAQALVALCKQRVGRIGGTAPSPARPAMVIVADLAALTGDHGDGVGSATAQLLMRGGRGPVKLTPAAARRLACDASLRFVLADGYEILGSADPNANVSPAAAGRADRAGRWVPVSWMSPAAAGVREPSRGFAPRRRPHDPDQPHMQVDTHDLSDRGSARDATRVVARCAGPLIRGSALAYRLRQHSRGVANPSGRGRLCPVVVLWGGLVNKASLRRAPDEGSPPRRPTD